ncbi:hypothetical protein GV828_01935 [Flavobacterium sp. NST-5]|uniref:Right handed beta helix domain-containing protein n=1 Tax=Flavobacterium ichthyis TaxID=2698827 RepID=A0ABW9Z5J9_9FLAO|nr:hypothetical protein [Flavobacterium ichthyis]NBL63954.1 hypothetical protein [Flavobacterium ichthyis]
MRNSLIILLMLLGVSIISCRNDFDFEPSTGNLTFSKDTVYLDTVFSNIGSSTYRLKVFNNSDKNILIPKIQLAQGTTSNYRMMIDGMSGDAGAEGKIFSNVELLAKDSMFVFIETTIDYNEFANPEAQYLYTDQILFDTGTNQQQVELATLVKDAVFLYPNRDANGVYEEIPIGVDENGETISGRGFFLDENELHWTNEKPYVIYGYAGVPPGQTLTVDPGTRAHFHSGSALIAYNGSSIKINGTLSTTEELENEVIFEGDRLEPQFAENPGQWLAIWLTNGSTGHEFSNLTIKNATVGILVSGNSGLNNPQADLTLNNVQIYNSSNAGILAETGYISGENVVVNWAGASCLYFSYGGKYNFVHSTFNNNWSGTRKYAVLLNNYIEGANPETQPLIADFINSIIFSSNQSGLLIDKKESSQVFETNFTKCQIKLSNSINVQNTVYGFVTDESNIIRNGNPHFLNVNGNKLFIGEESDAKGFGNYLGGNDLSGNPRNNPSDLGAYNFQIFEE